MNLLYTASKGEFGASPEFGKAAMGLMIAWAMNYLCVARGHWPVVAPD